MTTAPASRPDRPSLLGLKSPLAGRGEELGVLIKKLSDVDEERGSLIMVGGEAGVGKTRIAEEVISVARSHGFKVFVGRCLPGSPYVYMPFRLAFQIPLGPNRPIMASAIKHLIPAYDGLDNVDPNSGYSDESSLRDTIHLSTLAFLKDASAEAPVLLVLEDLQWSDSASLQLLHFLARNVKSSRIAILGNYRSEDLLPAGGKGSHPLSEMLRATRSEDVLTEIHLGPLDKESTTKAIEGNLGGALDEGVGSRIFLESGGNPLFALETAFLLVNMGNLIEVGGTWRPVDELNLRIPQTVREVILRRLDHVPPEARRVIEVASAIGTSFDPEVVLDVIPMDRMVLLEELEVLDRTHQLVMEDGERYQFRHEKFREITYETISGLRRRELHARIGRSLESRGGPDPLAGLLSYHYYHARMWDRCLRYSLLAGDGLLKRFAATEALPYYKRAEEALGADPTLEPERMRVLEGLADAYQETFDFARADDIYVSILPLITNKDGSARVLRKRMWCWDHDRLGNGSLEMQKKLIEEGLAIPEIDHLEHAEILSCQSSSVLHGGDADRAKEISEEAISIFRQARSMPRLAWELIYCGYIDLSQMRFDEALSRLSEAKQILKEHPWSIAENDADQHYGRIMVYQGRSKEAIEQFQRSLERSLQLGEYRVAGIACYYIALVYEQEGDLDMMEVWVDKALKYASQGGYRPQMAMLELLLAHLAFVKKDPKTADTLLHAAEDLYSSVHQSIRNFAAGMILIERGEVLYLKGSTDQGDASFEQGFKELMEVPNGDFYEALARRWYGDVLFQAGRTTEAREQYSMSATKYEGLSNADMATLLRER